MPTIAAKVALLEQHRAECARLQLEIADEMNLELSPAARKTLRDQMLSGGIKPKQSGPNVPLTREEYDKVHALRRAGNKPSAIADQLGISFSRLNSILYGKQVAKRFAGSTENATAPKVEAPAEHEPKNSGKKKRTRKQLTDELRETVRSLRGTGAEPKRTIPDIGKLTGLSKASVSRILSGKR